jgi:hypothetical protein
MTTDKNIAMKEKDEQNVLDAIAAMPDHDRMISERLHVIVKEAAPTLWARTWYGMPAYTDGSKIVCWFRSGKKFGERYITFGFNDIAKLDDGSMWPISFALTELTTENETRVIELMKKAVG